MSRRPRRRWKSFTDAADNETAHAIERLMESGLDWVEVATLPPADGTGTTLEFADDSVDMEQRYCYRVRAQGEHGIRFTYLDACDGRGQFHIAGLQPETGYCLRPWVFNPYGSRYGEQLCATTLPAQDDTPPANSVTYTTAMNGQFTSEGVIPYVHVVEPGPPRPAELIRVRVIGSSFSNYHVRFVRPQAGPFSCPVNEGDGVTIVPGSELSGSGLATLFGSETPEIPQTGLTLVGCKLLVGGGLGNTNPIPIDVTYRRP